MKIKKMQTAEQLAQIEELYLQAFPKEERKPFSLICQKRDEGLTEILYLEADGEFCGLAITISHGDLVLLDYFAIDSAKRNGGRGSAALQELMEYYGQQRLLIEIESTEEACENQEERIRREKFYHRNEMKDLNITVRLFGVVMVLLSNKPPVTYEEYCSLYFYAYGEQILKHIERVK